MPAAELKMADVELSTHISNLIQAKPCTLLKKAFVITYFTFYCVSN